SPLPPRDTLPRHQLLSCSQSPTPQSRQRSLHFHYTILFHEHLYPITTAGQRARHREELLQNCIRTSIDLFVLLYYNGCNTITEGYKMAEMTIQQPVERKTICVVCGSEAIQQREGVM